MRPTRPPVVCILGAMEVMRRLQDPAAMRVLLLVLAAGLIAIAVADMARGKSSTGNPRAIAAKGGPVPTEQSGPLYRIVGCASRGVTAYSHGPDRREVAIAFDDGPARDTAAFVSMLKQQGVPATFFMIGRQLSAGDRPLLLRELADGDALGDHTFNHSNLVTSRRVHAELAATIARIEAVSGYRPCIFRPPYGAFDRRVLHEAHALGLATIMWNVDPRDWSLPGKRAIASRILGQVRPGSIILSHDRVRPDTIAAYRILLPWLKDHFRIIRLP